VFPNFVRSAFNGRDFFSESEQCQHLFWNLTGERVESFLQIVRDRTEERTQKTNELSIRIGYAEQDPAYSNLAKMYPEVAVLSGMFMISPTTVQREIRVLLPLLWHYLKRQVQWPTQQQWLHMAHHWELFPGAVAVIDGTRHEIQRPGIERPLSVPQLFHADNYGQPRQYCIYTIGIFGAQQRQRAVLHDDQERNCISHMGCISL
jgi:hypothetical protein